MRVASVPQKRHVFDRQSIGRALVLRRIMELSPAHLDALRDIAAKEQVWVRCEASPELYELRRRDLIELEHLGQHAGRRMAWRARGRTETRVLVRIKAAGKKALEERFEPVRCPTTPS